jgi:hypothetical protein
MVRRQIPYCFLDHIFYNKSGLFHSHKIRRCGEARGVANCGICSEFDHCEKINSFMQMIPEVRKTFESLQN